MPIAEVVDYADKKFIVLWCPGGDNRPYSSPKTMAKDNKERIFYIRKMSNTVEPSDDEVKDLFSLANKIPFDDRVNHQAEISDLNITLIQNYLKGQLHGVQMRLIFTLQNVLSEMKWISVFFRIC